jgi:hypothetical protein
VLGVRKSIKENPPPPCYGNGVKPEKYVLPLTMEDIRKITLDKGMKQLCGFARLSGGDAIG